MPWCCHAEIQACGGQNKPRNISLSCYNENLTKWTSLLHQFFTLLFFWGGCLWFHPCTGWSLYFASNDMASVIFISPSFNRASFDYVLSFYSKLFPKTHKSCVGFWAIMKKKCLRQYFFPTLHESKGPGIVKHEDRTACTCNCLLT